MNIILEKDVKQHSIIYKGLVAKESKFYPTQFTEGGEYPGGIADVEQYYFVTTELNGYIVWYCDQFEDILNLLRDKVECHLKHFFYDRNASIECAHNLKRVDQIFESTKVERAKINT